jgi:hypothetical protein
MTTPTENEQKFLNKLKSMSSDELRLNLDKKVFNSWKIEFAKTELKKREKQEELNVPKEGNEIARENNEIAREANKKSMWSIYIACAAIIVSVISLFLHKG